MGNSFSKSIVCVESCIQQCDVYKYYRSSPSKKNPGKVPRTIRKAKREKLKRDNMNVLFLELAKTLGNVSLLSPNFIFMAYATVGSFKMKIKEEKLRQSRKKNITITPFVSKR